MIVLSWNLFHGRAIPERRYALLGEFAAQLATWEWDVALLQEVLPWWPPQLGRVAGASARTALTSRNQLLCLRRGIAVRRPDLIKSGAGGANAILVRRQAIVEHRRVTLRLWPERRVMHAVRLASGTWIANLPAMAHVEARAQADVDVAARALARWTGDAPVVLGGDFNLRQVQVPGFTHVAGHWVDHILLRGLHPTARADRPGRGQLSDHQPLRIAVREGSAAARV